MISTAYGSNEGDKILWLMPYAWAADHPSPCWLPTTISEHIAIEFSSIVDQNLRRDRDHLLQNQTKENTGLLRLRSRSFET